MGSQKKATAKTYQIRISQNAFKNIEEITGYIAFIKQEPLKAIKVGDAIFKVIDRIAAWPLAFRECEEIPTKNKIYRRALCYSWSVIYRVKDPEILILGVIHQSRHPHGLKSLRGVK